MQETVSLIDDPDNTLTIKADLATLAPIDELVSQVQEWAGHWGEPSELAGAAVFLASAAADYVHGITLPVDGGWLAR